VIEQSMMKAALNADPPDKILDAQPPQADSLG
jgi:hypothetical protein